MKRNQFIVSMGTSVISLLSGSSNKVTLAQQARDSGNGMIPRKAIVPAALTPIDEDGQVDIVEFRRHMRALADVRGVSAIMVNGGSGHDKTLTRDERRKLLYEALTTVGDRVPVIAAIRESEECPTLEPLAKDVQDEGAHAMTIMPPSSKEGLLWESARKRFEVACSASSLPVVIYQSRYPTETLIQLASLPPVFAVKEGSGDPATFERNMRALHSLEKDVAVWSTHSKWLLADLATGADGILSGMGSVAADLQVALAEAVEVSDLTVARQINDRIFPLSQVFYKPGKDAHVRMKYALKRLGRQKYDFVRPPLQAVNEVDRLAIDHALLQSGLLKE
ncbi:MAG: dihydrodipicolinate synthase family protein [Saprospiraceae bacterium]|nr:dihydrodipicolinate synthase family protein [Saprospiraceae bacterium]